MSIWKKSFLSLLFSILFVLLAGAFFLGITPYTTLVLLQNTQEKRATGGFLGSIAVIEHHGPTINNFNIYDIYQSDGQISEFLPAPAPVQQYLTGGLNQLHLPDANWERDFPTSSAQILELFSRAGRPQPDFVISLNLPVVEQIIDHFAGEIIVESTTGAQIITAANFATAARAGRSHFFPGDSQKTDFLRPAATALTHKLQNLPLTQKIALVQFLCGQAQAQELYFYSPIPFWQNLFLALNLAGNTHSPPPPPQQ